MNKEEFNFREENGLLILTPPVKMKPYEFNHLFPGVTMIAKTFGEEPFLEYIIVGFDPVIGQHHLVELYVEKKVDEGDTDYCMVIGDDPSISAIGGIFV